VLFVCKTFDLPSNPACFKKLK